MTQNAQLTTLQDLNYDFDHAGNLSTLVVILRSNIRTYQYDDLNRLTRAENIPDPQGGYSTFTYQYDSIGNMTYKSDMGAYTYGEGTAGPHAVTSAGGYAYSYDDNGNITYGRGKDFTYDAENRLIEVDNLGQVTTFEYNHSGNQIKKITSEETVTYIGKLYEERLAVSGERLVKKHIYTGSDRSITVETDTDTGERNTYYYHSDHLGSSNIITDDTSTQVQHVEHQPYGKVSRNEGDYDSPYKFTGKELDTTGLYYYGARYYDPEIGRFITADSFVQNPLDPQTLNRYTYCRNNPLIYTDPSGHFFWAIIIGAILGGIMAAATGGDIAKGIVFGALGGALTAGISSSIFSTFPAAAGSLVSKAAVYAISAFATSATIGAMQGVRGSDLWRMAGISAGVAFAATMVIGSISEAAKNQRTPRRSVNNNALVDEDVQKALSVDVADDIGNDFGKSVIEPWERRVDIYDTVDAYYQFGSEEMNSALNMFKEVGGRFEYDPSYLGTAYYDGFGVQLEQQAIAFGSGNWENPWRGYSPGKSGLERSLPHEIYHFMHHDPYYIEEPVAQIYGPKQRRILIRNRGY